MDVTGILFLIYRYKPVLVLFYIVFGQDEVASEKFMSLERGSDIVRLQDLNIFAGIPSTPVAFLEPDFEMNDCIFSLVIGLKSKGMGVGNEKTW